MYSGVIQHFIGLLLIVYSFTLLIPIGVAFSYQDQELFVFFMVFFLIFSIGLICWFPVRHVDKALKLRHGFIVIAIFWILLSLVSALPFLFTPHLDLAQSVFEAISGFTTTGATVITDLEHLPASILYYRQQLQWLGGLGIIIMAVAILPMLGIGGMQLYRAETPGPMHDDKLTPRLQQTAKYILLVYIVLTLVCTLAFWLAGMTLFDAIAHSFSTLSTGGFSTHDASLAYFNSSLIDSIAIIFMILGSLNFSLHFVAWRKLAFHRYWRDIQVKVFIFIILASTMLTVAVLLVEHIYTDFWTALRYASFQIVSIISTTGFLTADFSSWPSFLPFLILGTGFVGGCVGSTAGGFRVIRIILLYKQAIRGILRIIHPHAYIALKIGKQRIEEDVSQTVLEFSILYGFSYLLLSFLMMATQVDALTAFSATAACLNMVGPGLGEVAVTYASMSDSSLWLLSFTMLLGRLEIFTLIVLLTPAFWKR
ncbi:MAG: TrkH family potassium uptake protein [Pseudomonadota bacterium]|nr:TrkH family potassium uptake protein [Pseudomonadota bacterium]